MLVVVGMIFSCILRREGASPVAMMMENMMGTKLPEWAQDMLPMGHKEAATILGVAPSHFYRLLKAHPHYEWRGNKRVFYPDHIRKLREALDGDREEREAMAREIRRIKAVEDDMREMRANAKARGRKPTLRITVYEDYAQLTGTLGGKRIRKRFAHPGGEEKAEQYVRELIGEA